MFERGVGHLGKLPLENSASTEKSGMKRHDLAVIVSVPTGIDPIGSKLKLDYQVLLTNVGGKHCEGECSE